MIQEAEQNAEADKERRSLIEAANSADGVCADTEKALSEFGGDIAESEKEAVTKSVAELREMAMKGQAGDATVTSEAIRNKIGETQQASISLFQKVYEKRNAESQGQQQPGQDQQQSGEGEGEKKSS